VYPKQKELAASNPGNPKRHFNAAESTYTLPIQKQAKSEDQMNDPQIMQA
jgi:hypothetical protein